MTDDMPDGLDDAVAQLELARTRMHAQADAARQRRDALSGLTEELEAARGTARSARGEVVVIARATGAVDEIRFSRDVESLDVDALGRMTVATIASAQRAATAEAARLVENALGDGNPQAAEFRAEATRRFST